MIVAGRALARRLEWVEGANDSECVRAGAGSAVEAIGGGWAVFAGVASPLSRAIGLGLAAPAGSREVEAVETFFHSRGARATIDLCPLADPGLLDVLRYRGYRVAEFNNVMVRELSTSDPWGDEPRVRLAGPSEQDLWSSTVGSSFFESSDLSDEEMEIGRAVFRIGSSECYLVFGEAGQAIGGGALAVRERVALLFADGTIPAFRRHGAHRSLIRRRLRVAAERGCELATASVTPGGGSQRNFEHAGFQVAYTKATLVEP